MNPVLLDKTSRTASFEFIESVGPYLDEPISLKLNGESLGNTSHAVLTLNDLLPDHEYTLQIENENNLSFHTYPETAALDIREFGAIGDGTNDNTSSLQAAITACPAGGTVLFPPGVWFSGPIFIKSDITIYFYSGATLLGQSSRKYYPILPSRISQKEGDIFFLGSWEGDPDDCYAALLTGINVYNVAIVGAGVIDGNAAAGSWWQWPKEKRDARRPRTVFLNGCKNILF